MSALAKIVPSAPRSRAGWPGLGAAMLCFAAGVAVALPLASWVHSAETPGLHTAAAQAQAGAMVSHRITDDPSMPDPASVFTEPADEPAETPPTF